MSRWLFFPSGGFVPSDVASLVGWYDPSDSLTVTLSGSDVTAVSNKVIGGTSLTPSSGNPTISSGALNSLDVLHYGTQGVGMHTGAATYTGTDHSIMWLQDPVNTNGTGFTGTPANWVVSYTPGSGSTTLARVNGTPVTIPIFVDATAIPSGTTRGGLYNLMSNNTGWHILGFTGLDMSNWTDFDVLRYANNPTTASGWKNLGEICIFDATLSTSDRQKMEGYYAWKYALTSNLPASHPYKSTRP